MEEAALFGGPAEHPGTLISASRTQCKRDAGERHHCIARFAVEIAGKRMTLDRALTLMPGEHGWEVDSVEDAAKR